VKVLFGVVSLLVVLAIVGLLAVRQLGVGQPASAGTAAVAAGVGASAPVPLADVPRQVQRQLESELAKGMAQGARHDDADR
jgi:hypothetical protein